MDLPPKITDAAIRALRKAKALLDATHPAALFIAAALDEFIRANALASHELEIAIRAFEHLRDQDIHGAKTPRPIPTPVPFPPDATPPRGLTPPPRKR